MNRNYYCKVNSQEEANKLLKLLSNIDESILTTTTYIENSWNIVGFHESKWCLLDSSYLKKDFIKVPTSELIDYVIGKKLDKDALLEEAKRRYPVGTKFKVVHCPENIRKVTSHEKHDDTFVKASDGLHINFISDLIEGGKSSCISASVYFNGKWAEIVEYPKEQVVDNEEFKVGDWVVVTERHDENSANVGDVVRLVTIDNSSIPYEVSDDGRYNYAFSPSWCKKVRKALPHEIPNSNHSDLETDSGQFKWAEHCKLLFDKQVEEDRDYFNKAQAKFIDEMFKLNPLTSEECTKIKIPKLIDRSKLDIKIKETKVKQIKL